VHCDTRGSGTRIDQVGGQRLERHARRRAVGLAGGLGRWARRRAVHVLQQPVAHAWEEQLVVQVPAASPDMSVPVHGPPRSNRTQKEAHSVLPRRSSCPSRQACSSTASNTAASRCGEARSKACVIICAGRCPCLVRSGPCMQARCRKGADLRCHHVQDRIMLSRP